MLQKLTRLGQSWRRLFLRAVAVAAVTSPLLVAAPVYAADVTLSGQVTASSQAMASATVDVLSGTDVVGTDVTDSGGHYAVTVPDGTYDVRVTPPAASGYQVAVMHNVILNTSQTFNIVLVQQPSNPPGPVYYKYTVNVRDTNGTFLCGLGCSVYLETSDGTRYGSYINYSVPAQEVQAPAGVYKVGVEGGGNETYNISGINTVITLNADTSQDLTVNQEIMQVAVIDQNGDPVPQARATVHTTGGTGTQLLPGYQVSYGANQSLSYTSVAGSPTQNKVLPGSIATSVTVDSGLNAFDTVTVDNPTVSNGVITVQVHTNPPPPPSYTWTGKLKTVTGNQVFCGGLSALNCVYFETAGGQRYGSTVDFTSLAYKIVAPIGQYKIGLDGDNSLYNMYGIDPTFDFTGDMTQDFTVNEEPTQVHVVDQNGDPVASVYATLHTYGGTGEQLLPDYEVTYGNNMVATYTSLGGDADMKILAGTNITRLVLSDGSSTVDFPTTELENPTVTNGVVTATVQTTPQLPPPLTYNYTVTVKDSEGNWLCGLSCHVALIDAEGHTYVSTINYGIPAFQVAAPPGQYRVAVSGQDSSLLGDNMEGIDTVINLTGDMTQELIVNHVTLHVQVIDQNGDPVPQARIKIDTNGGTGTQLLPGYQVTYGGNYSYAYTGPNGESASAKVLPGSPITELVVDSPTGAFGAVNLGAQPAMTQDGTLVIHLQPLAPPDVPQGLDGTSPTKAAPELSWSGVSGAANYKVYRNGTEVGTPTDATFTDSALTANGSYSYTIASCNGAGCSAQSNPKTIVYDTTAPTLGTPGWGGTSPAQQGNNATLDVPVSDSLSGVAAGEYFVGADPGVGSATALTLTLNGTHLTASFGSNLTPGTYTVGVRARDNAGNWSTVSNASLVVQSPTPQSFTLTPSGDTYVHNNQGHRNFGAGSFMRVQQGVANRGLVRFSQSSISSQVGSGTLVSAKLRFTITDITNNWGANGRTVDVHRLLKDWTEGNGTDASQGTGSGATWNCAIDTNIANNAKNCSGVTEWEMAQPNNPTVHPWVETPSATQTITSGQSGVVEYDVTADVNAYLAGTYSNYGWLIRKTAENQNGAVNFGTKETATPPQLVITYQP